MRMLFGAYYHNVDTKGRVSIPSSFRKELGDDLILTIDSSKETVQLFPIEDYREHLIRLATEGPKDINSQNHNREIQRRTSRVALDSHGRILIPDILRQEYDIVPGNEVMLLGRGDMIEIWNIDRYNAVINSEEYDPNKAIKELEERGLIL